MEIQYGRGETAYGPGVQIYLSGDELATAITAYLTAHDVNMFGARTVRVCGIAAGMTLVSVYVDPSGFVIEKGKKWDGKGPEGQTTDL